jgi:hypothetical protein
VSRYTSTSVVDAYKAWLAARGPLTRTRALEYIDIRDKTPPFLVLLARVRLSLWFAGRPWTVTSDPDSTVSQVGHLRSLACERFPVRRRSDDPSLWLG